MDAGTCVVGGRPPVFCAAGVRQTRKKPRNTRTRRILRQAFRGCKCGLLLRLQHKELENPRFAAQLPAGATAADLLQCKGKEPGQFERWFCTVRCVPSLAAAGEGQDGGGRGYGGHLKRPHPNPPPLSLGRETESYVLLNPLPDRCIQPIPTRKNGAAPDSPPASCVLRGRRVRSPW